MLRIRPWIITLIFCVVYLTVVLLANGGDSLVFVTVGDCYSHCTGFTGTCAAGTENGYDGQFAYYIARDPFNAAPCIDVPAYRYQRILLPLLGRALALGVTDLIPLAFVAINLFSLVGATVLMESLLREAGVSRWYALVYGMCAGIVLGVRLSTTEPLAYGLAVLAIWLERRESSEGQVIPGASTHTPLQAPYFWWAAAALALGVLAKEMIFLFVAGYVLYYLARKQWVKAVAMTFITVVPFAILQVILYQSLGSLGIGSGGAGNSPFEIIPYNGFWRIGYDSTGTPAALLAFGLLNIPAVILPSLWGMWAAGREIWTRRSEAHFYAYLLLVNAAIMMFVPFSTYREPLGIIRFIVGLVVCHVLFAAIRYKGRRPLYYSPLWLALLFYLVAG